MEVRKLVNYIFIFCIVSLCTFESIVGQGYRQHDRNDLAITYSQKRILDKFKRRMSPIVPHKYMREEIYLIRWLRAADFDLKTAEEILIRNLKWRKQNRIDKILEEDFSDLYELFSPVYVDTFDKKGQPVATNTIWNFRRAFLTGKSDRVVRFIMMLTERAAKMIRERQKAGLNATRFNYILNMEGFNLIQHGCPPCMLTYFQILRQYETYSPEMIDRLVILNAPPTIRVLFEPLVRSAVNANTIRSINLKIFGTERAAWRKYLLKFIDEDQLEESFGGNVVRLIEEREFTGNNSRIIFPTL